MFSVNLQYMYVKNKLLANSLCAQLFSSENSGVLMNWHDLIIQATTGMYIHVHVLWFTDHKMAPRNAETRKVEDNFTALLSRHCARSKYFQTLKMNNVHVVSNDASTVHGVVLGDIDFSHSRYIIKHIAIFDNITMIFVFRVWKWQGSTASMHSIQNYHTLFSEPSPYNKQASWTYSSTSKSHTV